MSKEEKKTSFELQVGTVRIAVEGNQSYVESIIKRAGKIIISVLKALEDTAIKQKIIPPQGVLPSTGADIIDETKNWKNSVADKASIPLEQVERIFTRDDEQVLVYKWEVSESEKSAHRRAKLNREIAVLYMFANDVVGGRRSYSLDKLKEAFQELRLSYTDRDRDLKSNLQKGKLLRKDKQGNFELTPLGIKKAKDLLQGSIQK